MSNTATRLITLIMLLQRRPNQKAGGGAAQVLEPEALRQLVLERAQGLVALHSADLLDADERGGSG